MTPGTPPALEQLLRTNPTAFEFFQLVRVLERLSPGRRPVGLFSEPSDEVAQFVVNPETAFPASEVYSLDLPGGGPATVAVNFMGLTGPEGVLPYYYSLLVSERLRSRDPALRDFLDLFHHRIISLFYRAWEKYRFGVAYERDRQDRFTRHLKDLVGLGAGALQDRLGIRDEQLDHFAAFRHSARRYGEIRHSLWRAIPNPYTVAGLPQAFGHARTDNAQTENADVEARLLCHGT